MCVSLLENVPKNQPAISPPTNYLRISFLAWSKIIFHYTKIKCVSCVQPFYFLLRLKNLKKKEKKLKTNCVTRSRQCTPTVVRTFIRLVVVVFAKSGGNIQIGTSPVFLLGPYCHEHPKFPRKTADVGADLPICCGQLSLLQKIKSRMAKFYQTQPFSK